MHMGKERIEQLVTMCALACADWAQHNQQEGQNRADKAGQGPHVEIPLKFDNTARADSRQGMARTPTRETTASALCYESSSSAMRYAPSPGRTRAVRRAITTIPRPGERSVSRVWPRSSSTSPRTSSCSTLLRTEV